MDLGLADAVAVVTGGSKGMGRAVAEAFADDGARVAVLARGQAGLDETVEALVERGSPDAVGLSVDVTDPAAIDAAFAAVGERWGAINSLVNTIGPSDGTFDDLDDAGWDAAFALGLMAAVRATRAALPLLRAAEWGRIVNFAAHSIQRQSPRLVAYTASKAALTSVSKNLAKSLAADGILVNTISPGTIVTASFTEVLDPFLRGRGARLERPVRRDALHRADVPPSGRHRSGRPARRGGQHHRVPGFAPQRLRDRSQRERGRGIGLHLMDVDQLVDLACDRAGSDDFGEDTWREGLDVLVRSLRTEAALNDVGVSAMTDQIVGYLVNRLEVERWYARHPEIDDQQIVAPLFGLGLPRTGSTALSHLLAQDPARRSLRTWEAGAPCPPPESATEHTDPRIAQTQAGIDFTNQMFPGFAGMIPTSATGPQECLSAHGTRLPIAHLRGHGPDPQLPRLAARLRHGAGLPVPPAGAEAVAVALPARAMVAQDPGPHVVDRCPRRRVPRRPVRHDPP